MSYTEIGLLSLVSWYVLLVMSLGAYRTALVFGGKRAANSFSATGDDVDGFGQRLTRAHANMFENLPAMAAVMLYAIAADKIAITDGLAYALVGARVAQSLVHIMSTANIVVLIRFGFFLVQIFILGFWLLRLFGHL